MRGQSMKTIAIKKFIAREGLILLSFIGIGILSLITNSHFLGMLSVPGYFLYLIGRFVYWALRTLEIIKPKTYEKNT